MKNILLAISGLTPQIVTETLFALSVQKRITIDEIFIITTKRGKTVIEGKDKSASTPNTSLKKEINNLCRDYKINTPKFTVKNNVIAAEEESLELYDIKTDKDNILFPNKAAVLIKKLTNNSSFTIHASLSGGRKSMSAHLAIVLSLFARTQDKLYHVLTEEKFEFKNFYPKTKAEAKALTIAEIPFVKLRSLNSTIIKSAKNYSEIVEKSQEKLQFLTEDAKLIVELKNRTIRYKGNYIYFTPTEISIYFLFAEKKISNSTGYTISEIQSLDFANKLKTSLEENFHQYFDSKDSKHWHKKGVAPEYFLSIRSKLNSKIISLFENKELASQFKIISTKHYGDSSYSILAPKDKLGINYE